MNNCEIYKNAIGEYIVVSDSQEKLRESLDDIMHEIADISENEQLSKYEIYDEIELCYSCQEPM